MRLPPFQELVDAYWLDVARLCTALAPRGDGEDAAQRTWLRALEAYPSLRDGRNLRGWLLTIASHTSTDGYRDHSRRPHPVPDVPDRPALSGEPVDAEDEVWTRVRALPARQRAAVAMRYVLDLPHSQIASALETTTAASRRLVSDALAELRAQLSKDQLSKETIT